MWAGARPGMDVERKYTSFYYWGMPRASPIVVHTQVLPVGNAVQRRVNILVPGAAAMWATRLALVSYSSKKNHDLHPVKTRVYKTIS